MWKAMAMKLSKEELNRRVCQAIEPPPTHRPRVTGFAAGMSLLDSAGQTTCWFYDFHSGFWIVRDLTEPWGTVMLMERGNLGIEPTWTAIGEYVRNGWQAYRVADRPQRDYDNVGYGQTPGEAVLQAYALANGLVTQEEISE